jgi:hypothetical protein
MMIGCRIPTQNKPFEKIKEFFKKENVILFFLYSHVLDPR